MLHATHTDFSATEVAYAVDGESSFAASPVTTTVATAHAVPLHESALTASQPLHSGIDMVVIAVALIGAWMVLLGWALLARHLRLAEQPLTQQHQ